MLIDAHCHVSTECDPLRIDELVKEYAQFEDSLRLILMSTNHIDYQYVDRLAQGLSGMVTPCFGVHPWYSHLFSLDGMISKEGHYRQVFGIKEGSKLDDEILNILPDPIDFNQHLQIMRNLINKYDIAVLGEIGLDKLFRIPTSGFYGNPKFKESKDVVGLTNYKTTMEHQKRIFIEQLKIAVELNLPISVHNVKTSGVIHDIISKELLKSDYSSSVCLHSYTGSIETLELFLKSFKKSKASFYVSLSNFINNSEAKKQELEGILKVMPRGNVLTETDMTIDNMNPIEQLKSIRGSVLRRYDEDDDSLIEGNYHRYLDNR